MNAAGKIFVKTLLNAIRVICGIFQYAKFLSNKRGKFKLLGLRGDTLPSFLA